MNRLEAAINLVFSSAANNEHFPIQISQNEN